MLYLQVLELFFKDLSSSTLIEDVIRQLDENIPIIMCSLEKIFPPSFFDVMEHLVVHLPYKALLRGPVHNGWMYPYERSMKHLMGKAKNIARVEGSIVPRSLIEETSHFTSYYFGSQAHTRKGLQPDMMMVVLCRDILLKVFQTYSVRLDV